MKVAINRCYGGFGVSLRCLWELIQRKSANLDVTDIKEYFGGNNPNFQNEWESRRDEQLQRAREWALNYPPDIDPLPEGWLADGFASILYDLNAGKVYSYERGYGQPYPSRTDPVLIALIEERGSEWASGQHAKLGIVEVPDDASWEIDDYDGIESIHESHRSWV